MKAVILAGGFGTRLAEETDVRPKPLVEIGGRPILWHIMNSYAAHGITDFIVCCGYKANLVKRYFADFYLETSDMTVNLASGETTYHRSTGPDWNVTLVDTGLHTMTGGRLKRVIDLIGGDTFCMTYGDGVSDLNIAAAVEQHQNSGLLATVTTVPSPGRFGVIDFENETKVASFSEKPHNEMGWINAGFFVLEPKVVDYIGGDETVWEQDPLINLAKDGQLGAFRHNGFWRPMDTLRDKRELENMWESGKAPWVQ